MEAKRTVVCQHCGRSVEQELVRPVSYFEQLHVDTIQTSTKSTNNFVCPRCFSKVEIARNEEGIRICGKDYIVTVEVNADYAKELPRDIKVSIPTESGHIVDGMITVLGV